MANKLLLHKKITLLSLLCLFAATFSLYAQKTAAADEHFTQKIEWEKDEYALRYEVEIETVLKDGKTSRVSVEKTTDSKLSVSLPAGNYRYKITKFDFLDRAFTESEWFPFEIVKAIQPAIQSVEPDNAYYIKGMPLDITLTGSGFLADSTVELSAADGKKTPAVKIASIEENGTKAHLQIAAQNNRETSYTVTIKNPGKLSAQSGAFAVHEAVQPVISEAEPTQIILQKGENALISIECSGIDENTVFEFVSSGGKVRLPAGAAIAGSGKKQTAQITVQNPREDSYTLSASNPGGLSDSFKTFIVRRTSMPQLANATSGKYSLKKNQQLAVIFEGSGFQKDSLYYLLPQEKAQNGHVSISEKGAVACSSSSERPDGLVEAVFSAADLSNTVYTAVVENPGKLTSYAGRQEVTVIPVSDITFSGGIFIGKDLYNDTLISDTDKSYIQGISADMALIPAKTDSGYWGTDLSLLVSDNLKSDKNAYDLTMRLYMFHLNLLYQHPFLIEKLRLSLHAGPGITVISKKIDYSSSTFGTQNETYSLFVSAQAGAFVSFYPLKNMFVEAGCDFVHIFATDMPTGLILPALKAGIRL